MNFRKKRKRYYWFKKKVLM